MSDNIEFYDVKKRAKVTVPAKDVKKVTYEKETKEGKKQIRYAVKAELDGSKLTKFVSKEKWDELPG